MKPKLYIYDKLTIGDQFDSTIACDIKRLFGEKIEMKLALMLPSITGLKCCTLSYGEEYIDYPKILYEKGNRWYDLETGKWWKNKVDEIGPY